SPASERSTTATSSHTRPATPGATSTAGVLGVGSGAVAWGGNAGQVEVILVFIPMTILSCSLPPPSPAAWLPFRRNQAPLYRATASVNHAAFWTEARRGFEVGPHQGRGPTPRGEAHLTRRSRVPRAPTAPARPAP